MENVLHNKFHFGKSEAINKASVAKDMNVLAIEDLEEYY